MTEATEFIAENIVEHADLKKQDIDENEDELNWAKRQVVQNCIYGVDINELAVELGKLSLWIETMAEGKPLNFLDHHLKHGNSLIGSDFDEIFSHPTEKQKRLDHEDFNFSPEEAKENFQRQYKEIEQMPENTVKEIHEKEQAYKKFISNNTLYQQFQQLANTHTRQHFEKEANSSDYESFLINIGNPSNPFEDNEWYKNAQSDAEDRNYFHWQLEFPKVFFGEQNGFDAVVGNPPYVRMSNIPQFLREYVKSQTDLFPMRFDLFSVFLEKADQLTDKESYYSFIIPDTLLTNDNLRKQREKLIENRHISQIIRCGEDVFPDATVSTCILVIQTNGPGKTLEKERVNKNFVEKGCLNQSVYKDLRESRILDVDTVKQNQIVQNIDGTQELEELVELRSGIQVWQNTDDKQERPDLLTEEKISEEHEPIITGNEIHKYTLEDPKKWINYKPDELERAREKRIHNSEKLVFKYIGRTISAAVDNEGHYILKSVVGGLEREEQDFYAIATQLNSKLMQFIYNTFVGSDSYPRINLSNLKKLPIKEKEGKKLSNLAKEMRDLKDKQYKEINDFLDWIKADWGVDVDDLSLKTHLREYWEYDFDEFMRVAKKNKSSINGDVKSRDFRERMKEEWESSMATLRPLMEEIDRLENEIDAIVFDLYDLTEEEVETVLDSLDTDEGVKTKIIQKFEDFKSNE